MRYAVTLLALLLLVTPASAQSGEGTPEQPTPTAGLLRRARAVYALAIDEIVAVLPKMSAN